MKPAEAIGKFTQARTELDPGYRAKLLETALDEKAQWEDAGQVTVGREQISAKIGEQLTDPAFLVSLTGRPAMLTDRWEFSWRILASAVDGKDSSVVTQEQRASVAANATGRLETITTAAPRVAPKSVWRRMNDALGSNVLASVALVAGLAYAALRIPLSLFYNDLGVTPEQAGFGTDELVKQSAGLLAAILVVAVIVGVAAVAYFLPYMVGVEVARRLWATDQRKRARAVASILLFPHLLAVVFLLFLFSGDGSGAALLIFDFVILALLVLAPYFARMVRGAEAARSHVTDHFRRRGARNRSHVVEIAYFLCIGLFIALPYWAHTSARKVREGDVVSTIWVPWKARPAQLRWDKDATPVKLNNTCRALRYLGGSDKRLIVYDTKLDQAFSIPEAEAVVATVQDCAPHPRQAHQQAESPTLKIADAQRRLRVSLASRFGTAYPSDSAKPIRECDRRSAARVRCRMRWRRGRMSYRGRGTVWLARGSQGDLVHTEWRVRRVDRCCVTAGRRHCARVYRGS